MADVVIPLIAAQVYLDTNTNSVTVNGGAGGAQTLATDQSYYFVSPKSSSGDGQSLLQAIKNALVASDAAGWDIYLSSADSEKIKIVNGTATGRTITFSATLATNLGFTAATTSSIGAGSSLVATYKPRWTWSAYRVINKVGPVMFDPAIQYQHRTSMGSVGSRSADQKATYLTHGEQGEAIYMFDGVFPAYRARPDATYVNEDLEGFWSETLRRGYKVLWWRNYTDIHDTASPSGGASSPFNCIQYAPQDELVKGGAMLEQVSPGNLKFWNVRLPFWVTEDDEAIPA